MPDDPGDADRKIPIRRWSAEEVRQRNEKIRTEAERREEARRSLNREFADGLMQKLSDDERNLRLWFERSMDGIRKLHDAAHLVRTSAQALVDDLAVQETSRFTLDQELIRRKDALDRLDSGLPRKIQIVDVPPILTDFLNEQVQQSGQVTWEGRRLRDEWREPIADEHDLELSEAADRIEGLVTDEFQRYADERALADEAKGQADQTAREALRRSSLTLDRKRQPGPSLAARIASVAPLTIFIFVSVVGLGLPPTPDALLVAGLVLILITVGAIIVAWFARLRNGYLVALGAGASFAFFAGLYLICLWVDPTTIAFPAGTVPHVAETALVSLTIAVTAGTLDVGLNGAARVVAYVQILLWVGAIARAVTWGWQRLLEHRETASPPAPPQG